MSFRYLIDTLEAAEFETRPFRLLHIGQFLSPEHFRQVVHAPEVRLPAQSPRQVAVGNDA